ncbi:hypothetical protein V1512DRAFT_248003 [Lipomyces arxii]|uniref:uncharacterized protein n=1 Tax=Lipomyces arxii TaxID=56418 RepID=UPI0034CE6D3D
MKSSTPNGSIRIMRRETGVSGDGNSESESRTPPVANELGGRSATPTTSGTPTTLEERTAAYQEARKRIFKDFPESGVSGEDDDDSDARVGDGSKRGTSEIMADDEDFPRRSQYIPVAGAGPGYYYDRNLSNQAYYQQQQQQHQQQQSHYSSYGYPYGGANASEGNYGRQYRPNIPAVPPGMPMPMQQVQQTQSQLPNTIARGQQNQFPHGLQGQAGWNQWSTSSGQYANSTMNEITSLNQMNHYGQAQPGYAWRPHANHQQSYQRQQQVQQQQIYASPDQFQQSAAYAYQQQSRYGHTHATALYPTRSMNPTQAPAGSVAHSGQFQLPQHQQQQQQQQRQQQKPPGTANVAQTD